MLCQTRRQKFTNRLAACAAFLGETNLIVDWKLYKIQEGHRSSELIRKFRVVAESRCHVKAMSSGMIHNRHLFVCGLHGTEELGGWNLQGLNELRVIF